MLCFSPLTRRHAVLFVFLTMAAVATACSSSRDSYTRAPVLSSTSPTHGARGVPLNATLSVDFDRPMEALTSNTFTVRSGNSPVTGVVATSVDGSSATFKPNSPLAANTSYTAIIGRDVTSIAGTKILDERSWTFTTGGTSDAVAPKITSARPTTGSHGVAINSPIVVTFDKAINPFSISPATFSLMHGTTAVSGQVSYGPGTTATMVPTNPLLPMTLYTASVSAAVADLQGNRLANPVSWSFTTGTISARGPAAIGLGSAANYVILSKFGISTVPTSKITGDIGLSGSSAVNLVGFDMPVDTTDGHLTSSQVNGKIYSDRSPAPAPANMAAAVANMEAAYSDAASRLSPDYENLGDGNIGGRTLSPGLYKWDGTLTIPSNVTLSGGVGDVWIFQTTGDLFMSTGAKIMLTNGAQAKNIYWQVAGQAIIGPTAHFEGTLLSKSSVTLINGATMNGRILAHGQVALQQATLTQPVSK
jgi:hypothetical protein